MGKFSGLETLVVPPEPNHDGDNTLAHETALADSIERYYTGPSAFEALQIAATVAGCSIHDLAAQIALAVDEMKAVGGADNSIRIKLNGKGQLIVQHVAESLVSSRTIESPLAAAMAVAVAAE